MQPAVVTTFQPLFSLQYTCLGGSKSGLLAVEQRQRECFRARKRRRSCESDQCKVMGTDRRGSSRGCRRHVWLDWVAVVKIESLVGLGCFVERVKGAAGVPTKVQGGGIAADG